VGADLSDGAATGGPVPVVLPDGDQASGLADMLHQFVAQTLADSPRKVQQARRLTGHVVFRSAEDEALCVRITFAGDRIQVQDGGATDAAEAMITADFLTMAHLASGQESPMRLLARRKLQARFSLLQVPFLLGLLRFMHIDGPPRPGARVRWLWPVAVTATVAAAAAGYWYFTAHF